MNYVDLLSTDGDPTEKSGINKYKLGENFPRYAEFWGKYVVPNRDPDPMKKHKLRDSFPVEIEEIFNTHYSIFYQLTFAYEQIEYLSSAGVYGVVDIGSPFYHLSTAVDLVERIFVAVFRFSRRDLIKRLNWLEFIREGIKCWNKYPEFFREFSSTLRPVTFNIHSVTILFNATVPKNNARRNFNRAQDAIRPYRNKFIHGVSPLRLMKGNVICLPKKDKLKHYVNGRWSSMWDDTDPNHYDPAIDLMLTLANDLAKSANDLWEQLIEEIAPHVPMPESRPVQELTPPQSTGAVRYVPPQEKQSKEVYTGGTPTYTIPATRPSGIKYIGGDSDGDPLG